MENCKLCGCLGWFFNLNHDGLCPNCGHIIALEVGLRSKSLADAEKRVETTLNPHSKIAGLDLAAENLEALKKLEDKGIPTIGDSPSRRLSETLTRRKELIVDTAVAELKGVLFQAKKVAELEARRRLYSDFLLKLEDYKKKSGEVCFFDELESRVREALHQIQLNEILEKASSLEAAGDKSGALAEFLEAHTFIKKAGLKGPLPASQMAKLNGKIKKLGGKPPRA